MTQLRKRMLEELERRNYAQSTTGAYLRTIEDLARYFKRPPDQLGPEHIREYQAYLFRERKLSPNTVNQRTGALRFFFIIVLKKPWSIAETPYPRRNFRLPKILSQEQVANLIDSQAAYPQIARGGLRRIPNSSFPWMYWPRVPRQVRRSVEGSLRARPTRFPRQAEGASPSKGILFVAPADV